jgi:hypothetical protein
MFDQSAEKFIRLQAMMFLPQQKHQWSEMPLSLGTQVQLF